MRRNNLLLIYKSLNEDNLKQFSLYANGKLLKARLN